MNGNGLEQEIADQKKDGALSRGILKQVKNNTSIHFNAEMTNSEFLFKILFSANQLSIYGAVADCYRFGAKENEQAGNPSAHEENVNQGLMNSVTAHDVSSLVSTPRQIEASRDRSTEKETIDDMPSYN